MKNENRLKSLTACTMLFGLISLGCSDSKFGANATGKKSSEKRSDNSSDKNEALGQASSENDDEDKEADVAVQVSGAYLTCQTDSQLAKGADEQIGIGCTVFEKDGRHLELSGFTSKFSVLDAAGSDTGASFTSGTAPYDAIASIPAVSVDAVSARVTVSKGDVRETWTSKITPGDDIKGVPKSAKPVETLFGSDTDFHIGDGNFPDDANEDCKVKPQKSAEAGKKIIVKMEVKSEAAIVSVTLGEICGISRSGNYIIFSGNSFFPPQKSIKEGDNELVFSGSVLKKGNYSFEVRSDHSWDDYDDFIVGKISFVAEGDVVFTEPVAGD